MLILEKVTIFSNFSNLNILSLATYLSINLQTWEYFQIRILKSISYLQFRISVQCKLFFNEINTIFFV